MGRNNKRKWTVFFLIKSVDDSINELITMINEIRNVSMNNHVSLILCINVKKGYVKNILTGKAVTISNESEIYTTVFYSLVFDNTREKTFINKLECLGEDENFDITNPNSLQLYFKNTVLKNYSAKRYVLFTWDHGSAFGIFVENSQTENEDHINGVVIKKQDRLNVLTMEELRNALLWAFGKKKIDVLIMMNCYMQFVDTGYGLRKSVKYLVAPETAMAYNGYNYGFILQLLNSNPGLRSKKLAKKAVSSFPSKLYLNREAGILRRKSTALYAVDLKYYELLAKLIDKLSTILISSLPDLYTPLMKARNLSYLDSSRNLVDFFAFVSCLEQRGFFSKNIADISVLISLKQLLVIKSHNEIVQDSVFDNIVNSPSGLSIFFPKAMINP